MCLIVDTRTTCGAVGHRAGRLRKYKNASNPVTRARKISNIINKSAARRLRQTKGR